MQDWINRQRVEKIANSIQQKKCLKDWSQTKHEGMLLSSDQVYVMYHGGLDQLFVIECHEIPDRDDFYSC